MKQSTHEREQAPSLSSVTPEAIKLQNCVRNELNDTHTVLCVAVLRD